MPVTVDATVGGVNANSTVDIVYADAYFAVRPNSSAWTDILDSDDKGVLLLTACRNMELEEDSLAGRRATTTQALSQPRLYGYRDCSASYVRTDVLNGTAIAKEWKDAQCEAAIELAERILATANAATFSALAAFSEVELPGGIKIKLRDMIAQADATLSPAVRKRLARFRRFSGGLAVVRM